MEDSLKLVHGYDGKTKYTGIEKYIFSDVYNFFLKYRFTENNSYTWEHLMADAKILAFKYHDYALAQDLITATVAQLEFIICGTKIKQKTYEEWEQTIGDYKNMKPFNPKTFVD